MRKRKSLIILLLLPLLLAGCQSYKKVPYLQDALQEVAAGDTILIFFEDDRVVCYRVNFNIYMIQYIIHCILAGAVNLR